MTYDKKALQELRARVEDGSVALSDFHSCFTSPYDESSPEISNKTIHAYGGSLDAAISLLEAVLPGWVAKIDTAGYAMIYTPTHFAPPDKWYEAWSETPSRALLLAILSALIEGERE